ncbi:MAG: AraC family transcriptional regulator [Kiritimatiellia bacterium]
MIDGQNMNFQLSRIGYFISGKGGAEIPSVIQPNTLYFELITRGKVRNPANTEWRTPGWIFAHRPGQETIHVSPPDSHYECMTAHFQTDTCQDVCEWPREFRWEESEEAVRFAGEMVYAFHHSEIEHTVLGDFILAQFRFRLKQDQVRSTRNEIPARIAEVMEIMDRQLHTRLSIEDLAAQVDVSASHLFAEFKAATAKSPHQYLIQQRMSAARHRLVTTLDPVKAIAYDIGYTNTENFCRSFKRATGLTAASFRKKYRVYG